VVFAAGTVLALFRNGVEVARSTADGNHLNLNWVGWLTAAPTDVFTWQVYTPAGVTQGLYVYLDNNNPYNFAPLGRIIPTPAIASGAGLYSPPSNDHYGIAAVVTPGQGGTQTEIFILKNGLPIANSFLNSDATELCRLQTDAQLVTTDTICAVITPTKGLIEIDIHYISASSPRLTADRWVAVP
jgi:hypothetical protein